MRHIPGVSPKTIAAILAAALCSLVLLQAGVAARGVTAETVLHVEPVEQQVAVGQEVSVDLYITDVVGLYGADVRLTFDPLLLAVVDANPALPDVQVTLGPLLTSSDYFAVRNGADNGAGTIWVALAQMNPSPAVTGSGVFLSIKFQALAEGASIVHVSSIQLADRNGSRIPAATQDGAITVTSELILQHNIWLPVIVTSLQ
jgi:hypothetical protein